MRIWHLCVTFVYKLDIYKIHVFWQRKILEKKKKSTKKPKGWKFPTQKPDEEEEEDLITEDKLNPQTPLTSEGTN